jgi:hypothetical protein
MFRHASLYLAAALPALAHAAPAYQFDLTGEQFAAALAKQPTDPFTLRERDRAYAYLDGVKDAIVGKEWCPPQPRKTHELAYDAAAYIRSLHADLRQGNAARLLVAYLATTHPCK